MPQGKLRAIGRGPVEREQLVAPLGRQFLDAQCAPDRKGVRNTALFLFGSEHENLPQLGESACEGVHFFAFHPIIIRNEDARFSCVLHVLKNIEKPFKF